MKKGDHLYAQRKYEDAELAYRKALKKDPRLVEANYGLALALVAQGKNDKAILPLRRAINLRPDHLQARAKLADIFLGQWLRDPRRPDNLFAEIRVQAAKILEKNPASFDGLRLQGHVAMQDNDDAKALACFEKANALKPADPEVAFALADLLYASDPKRSETFALGVLDADKTNIPMYDLLYQRYRKEGRVEDAENLLKRKLQNLPRDGNTYLQLAAHYDMTKRPQEMKRVLDSLLAQPSVFPNRFMLAGDFYLGKGDLGEAFRNYEQGSRADAPRRKEYQTRMANVLLAEGRKDEATRVIEAYLKSSPQDPDVRAAKASLLLDSGKREDVAEGMKQFAALVKEEPGNAFFRFALGRAHLLRGEMREAETNMREAARRDRNFVPARLQLAEMELDSGRVKEGLGYAADVLQIDPRNPRALTLLIRGLQLSGRTADARKELDRLLKDFPQSREAQLQSGYLLIDEKRFKDAEELFLRLHQPGKDDAAAFMGLAEVYAVQNQLPKALNAIRTEVDKYPQSRRLRELLAGLAVRAGDPRLATEQLQALLAAGVRTDRLYRSLAEAQYMSGQLDEAIRSLREAQKIAPEKAETLVTLAGLIDQKGNAAEAQALYKRALELDGQNVIAMNNLAYNLAENNGDMAEALRLATRASQTANDPNYLDTLGWVYLKKQDSDSALHIFRNLVEKQPRNATFRLHLGMAMLAKGDRAGAKQQFEQALTSNPPPSEAAQIRSMMRKVGS